MMASLGDRKPELQGTQHFIAPSAAIIGSVRLHNNASIWFNAVLRGDNDWIEIGEDSNIQDGSILHTDPGLPLVVGKRVTVGHKVMLHGCTIGDQSLVGIGSIVLNRASIGRHCLVGANSLVTEGKSYPDGVLIMGSPAKIVRELGDDEISQLAVSAQVYVENGRCFSEQMAEI